MITEVYKTIEDYPNYEVSNLGNVRNRKTGLMLRPDKNNDGYLRVNLCKNGKSKMFKIHRLVASAFIPNPEHKRTVNHINGIKIDNRLENLEWATHSENVKHAFKTGLTSGRPKQKVRCVETKQEFTSMTEAGRYFKCGVGSIWASIRKGWGCKGHHFELI